MRLNNVYIKTLGLPVCSAFHETITGHWVGYYTSLNLHGTESGNSFISGNPYPGMGNSRSRGPLWGTDTGLTPCPWATATLDFQRACRGVGWCLEPEQCLSCAIYPSASLTYLPCLKVFFFTEILHNAGVQEAYGKVHVQGLYRKVRKQPDFLNSNVLR